MIRKWIYATIAWILILIIFTAWYVLPLGPIFDDGPFHGRPTAAVNDRLPDQTIPIWGGNAVEVYDSPGYGVSATVQLRREDGSIQWAVLADGHQSGDARSVRFLSASRGFARSGTVRGFVEWTYGREATSGFITGAGNLRDYWYSW